MKMIILGKDGCEKCALAKQLLPTAEYHQYLDAYGLYNSQDAVEIITASNGELPIIIMEGTAGRMVLTPAGTAKKTVCKDGLCSIK